MPGGIRTLDLTAFHQDCDFVPGLRVLLVRDSMERLFFRVFRAEGCPDEEGLLRLGRRQQHHQDRGRVLLRRDQKVSLLFSSGYLSDLHLF